jgi:hypothetical protein
MGHRGSDAAHLTQRVKALITTISSMESEYPLKPVWGGLPRGDEHGRIVDEPPVYDEAEQQILALREPLTCFLKDTKRFIADFGTSEQKQRFRENALVEVAFVKGPPGRRGYLKTDCVADLRSIQTLLQDVPLDRAGVRTAGFGGDLPAHLIPDGSSPPVGQSQRQKGGASIAEPHFSVKQLAELWGFSERTIRRLIEDEPEVVMIHKGSRLKRTYRRVQIPASVAERIHRKLAVRHQ